MVSEFLDLAVGVVLILLTFTWVILVIEISSKRKTKKYREELADLYVAGKTKQLATTDSIDLAKEFEDFKKWAKKQKLQEEELDVVIEGELKEKISEVK